MIFLRRYEMPHPDPTESRLQAVRLFPIAGLPAGEIAQAWLEKYSRRMTWADLTAWLRDR
jgi:hypothetical protein